MYHLRMQFHFYKILKIKGEVEINSNLQPLLQKNDQMTNLVTEKTIKNKKPNNFFEFERKLMLLHKPDSIWLIAGIISQILFGAIFPINSMIFSQIFTLFYMKDLKQQEKESLQYMGIIIGLIIVNLMAYILQNYAFALVGSRLTKQLRLKMFESILRQEIGFFDLEENKSKILIAQLSASTGLCRNLTSDTIGLLVQGISRILAIIIIVLTINWKFGLIMLIFVPTILVIGSFSNRVIIKEDVGLIERVEKLAIESVVNINTVASLGCEEYFVEKFAKAYDQKFKRNIISLHTQAIFFAMLSSMLFFIHATAFSFGFYIC